MLLEQLQDYCINCTQNHKNHGSSEECPHANSKWNPALLERAASLNENVTCGECGASKLHHGSFEENRRKCNFQKNHSHTTHWIAKDNSFAKDPHSSLSTCKNCNNIWYYHFYHQCPKQHKGSCLLKNEYLWTRIPNTFWEPFEENTIKEDTLSSPNKKETHTMTPKAPVYSFATLKQDGGKAGIRIAGHQITQGTKQVALSLLEKNGQNSDTIKVVKELLDTKGGDIAVGAVLGMILTFTPGISNDPRVATMAEEFRVQAMANGGNAIFDQVREMFLPMVQGIVNELPAVTEVSEETNVRVSEGSTEGEEVNLEELGHTEENEDKKELQKMSVG